MWMVVVVAFVLLVSIVRAEDIYAAPDLEAWYASLMQPDNSSVSCCGWGDAYYADKTDTCNPGEGGMDGCALVAIITDERPDTRTLPDGRVLHRAHIAVGTRIPVPPSKVRKHPVPNPTDHNIIFARVYEGWTNVYCWEP